MKKKIITLLLSFTIIFSNVINSFANPIVAIPISYELLTGLMTVGVAFGLSLPNNDDEYWEYTRNLKKHLQVVDDDYLKLLDKTFVEWKNNNYHKKDEDKEPLKIPIIPGAYEKLKQLFTNVGNDSQGSYSYYNDSLNPLEVVTGTNKPTNYKKLFVGDEVTYSFVSANGTPTEVTLTHKARGHIVLNTVHGSNSSGWQTYPSVSSDGSLSVAVVYSEKTNSVVSFIGSTQKSIYFKSSDLPAGANDILGKQLNVKPAIPYSPTEPSIENDELVVPNLPSINIPSVEEIPNYSEGLEPPFYVEEEYIPTVPGDTPGDTPGDNPGDTPGGNPGENPDTDINGSLFPSTSSISEYIKSLVVPSDSFWTDTFNSFRDNFSKNFPMLDMSKFDSLAVGGKPFPNLYAYGSKIVDGDVINSIVDWLRPIIAGFIMICLMFFNYRKIYKLIRNTEPFGSIAQGTSDFRTGLSAPPINNGLDSNPMGNLRDTLFDMRNEILRRENEK